MPPKAQAFSKFKSSKGVISSPSALDLKRTAYQGGQEACPLKLKHFLKLALSERVISRLSKYSISRGQGVIRFWTD